jgi:hypothetical protein
MTIKKSTFLFIRILLAITFLWVVADRLSLLGPAGNTGVVWGNFENFLDYTATLNPWFPRALSDFLGYLVTIVEVLLAVLLVSGIRLKEASLTSFALLNVFILSMIFSIGFKESFDFIVFTVILAIASVLIYWNSKLKVI